MNTRWLLTLFVLVVGCGHAGQGAPALAPVAASGASRNSSQQPAAQRAADAGRPAAAHAEATQAPPVSPAPTFKEGENLDSYMVEHFLIVSYARDAVITGRLSALRRAMGALANYKYDQYVAPGDWQPWIAKLQDAARAGASARTLHEGAVAVANTAAVCAECHATRGAGPHFPDNYDADGDMGLSNTLSDRMERHAWAADRMWEGLIAPSDLAWRAGSSELANVPRKTPAPGTALTAALAKQLRELRQLGGRAQSARLAGERVAMYATLLTKCAECHDREVAF